MKNFFSPFYLTNFGNLIRRFLFLSKNQFVRKCLFIISATKLSLFPYLGKRWKTIFCGASNYTEQCYNIFFVTFKTWFFKFISSHWSWIVEGNKIKWFVCCVFIFYFLFFLNLQNNLALPLLEVLFLKEKLI
jgi:hypothetical protein